MMALQPARSPAGLDCDMPDLTGLLQQWNDDLAAWAIPVHITAAVAESPWVLPRQVFARRADRLSATPSGPSYERAWTALDPPGSLLDVGSGAGAACLPLLPRATSLTAVDTDEGMLELLAHLLVEQIAFEECPFDGSTQIVKRLLVVHELVIHVILISALKKVVG